MAWKKLSSGKKTSSGLVVSGPCYYFGFTTVTGRIKYQVTIYDSTSESGTIIEDYSTDASKEMDGHSHAHPVVCRNGIYLSLGGGSAVVYYAPIDTIR
jgi:hypothetical protein